MATQDAYGGIQTVTKATWFPLNTVHGRYIQLICRSATSGHAVTITVWGSADGGTTYFPLMRADTLAPAKSIAISVGTLKIGSGSYVDSVVLAVGQASALYIAETAAPTPEDFIYQVGAL